MKFWNINTKHFTLNDLPAHFSMSKLSRMLRVNVTDVTDVTDVTEVTDITESTEVTGITLTASHWWSPSNQAHHLIDATDLPAHFSMSKPSTMRPLNVIDVTQAVVTY